MSMTSGMKAFLREHLPKRVYQGLAHAYGRVLAGRSDVPNQSLLPPDDLNPAGVANFQFVGNEFLGYFKLMAGLEPSHRVLDVGCGIGRMAVPMLDFLSAKGSYEGFDIIPSEIQWCSDIITPRNPAFRFQFVDIRNQHYNPSGRHLAAEFVFPYPDGTFDLVFLTSVFTHLLPVAVANYLGEIRRVLKPGGRCLVTWFILNPESEKMIEEKRSSLDIRHALDGCLTASPENPEKTIGYRYDRVLKMYEEARLSLEQPVRFGSWCGRKNGLSYQDICVAHRPRD